MGRMMDLNFAHLKFDSNSVESFALKPPRVSASWCVGMAEAVGNGERKFLHTSVYLISMQHENLTSS